MGYLDVELYATLRAAGVSEKTALRAAIALYNAEYLAKFQSDLRTIRLMVGALIVTTILTLILMLNAVPFQ